jgi:hypothetical protein
MDMPIVSHLHHGERVLKELNDSGPMQARCTTENGSYFGMWLHLCRPNGTLSRFPMFDNIGTARGLVDGSATVTDSYELDAFGRQVSSSGTTPNPYRYGAAWGYLTDPPITISLLHLDPIISASSSPHRRGREDCTASGQGRGPAMKSPRGTGKRAGRGIYAEMVRVSRRETETRQKVKGKTGNGKAGRRAAMGQGAGARGVRAAGWGSRVRGGW